MRIAANALSALIAFAFVGTGAVVSHAQVPYVQIYFNSNLTETQGHCPGMHEFQELYVVCNNFNAWISTVEFGVDFGSNWPLMYIEDIHNPGALRLGNSYDPFVRGVTITYPIPGNGYGPFIAMRIRALWLCDECELGSIPSQAIVVMPHETTGNLQGIVFQTFEAIDAVGMWSIVCPYTLSTEEKTWGAIKGLYR